MDIKSSFTMQTVSSVPRLSGYYTNWVVPKTGTRVSILDVCSQAREENWAKQWTSVINCNLLGPSMKIKGVVRAARWWGCLGRRWVAVISSKMTAWSTGGGRCWKIFSRQLLAGIISRVAATGSCSQTHKSLMLHFQQLHGCSCYSMPVNFCNCIWLYLHSFRTM